MNIDRGAKVGDRSLQVRGAAALIVAVAHAWQVFLYPFDKNSLAFAFLVGAASWSVAAFFLLSGLLIALSIKRRIAGGRFETWSYFRARAWRIYPPLLAAVFVTVLAVVTIQSLDLYGAASYWLPGDKAASRDRAEFDWPAVLGTLSLTYYLVPGVRFVSFNGPLWSLIYEVWFYIVAGLTAASIVNRSWLAGAGAAAIVAVMLFVSDASPDFLPLGVVWAMGFATGWHWQRVRALRSLPLVATGSVCLTLALVAGWPNLSALAKSPYGGMQASVFYVLVGAAILSMMVVFIRGKGAGMAGRFFGWIGTFSYTLYVVHFPLLMFSLSLFRPSVVPFGVAGHAALALTALTAVVFLSESLALITERSQRRTPRYFSGL